MNLTDLQKDCLQEIVNVAYGDTTAVVAALIDAYAKMGVPDIKLFSRDELAQHFETRYKTVNKYFMTTQFYTGEYEGEVLFIVDESSAKNLSVHVNKSAQLGDSEIADSVLELSNIVTTTTIRNLAKGLGIEVNLLTPQSDCVSDQELIDTGNISDYDEFIIISTVLDFEEEKIYGELIILNSNESFGVLKKLLDKVIEEMMG